MSEKKKNLLVIILSAVASVAVFVVVLILLMVIPRYRHFNNMYIIFKPVEWLYDSPEEYENDTHQYYYLATNPWRESYVVSDTDLSAVLEDHELRENANLGEQKIKVRYIGTRKYSTDMLGNMVIYRIPVYEYVE